MKLLVVSDLHLEHGMSFTTPDVEFDAVVLAHSPGHKAVHWAQRESTFSGNTSRGISSFSRSTPKNVSMRSIDVTGR